MVLSARPFRGVWGHPKESLEGKKNAFFLWVCAQRHQLLSGWRGMGFEALLISAWAREVP